MEELDRPESERNRVTGLDWLDRNSRMDRPLSVRADPEKESRLMDRESPLYEEEEFPEFEEPPRELNSRTPELDELRPLRERELSKPRLEEP